MSLIEPPDGAARQFFEHLNHRQLMTTRCRSCGTLHYPPRAWCPNCLEDDLEWIELSGRGELAAFSTQEQGLRFRAPDVLGLVDLEEGVRILSLIAAPYEELRIGQPLRVEFFEVQPGEVLHRFRPVA